MPPVIERQLKDATPCFLLVCNPYARDAEVEDLGDEPTYCEYLERLDKGRVWQARSFCVHQLIDLAGKLGLMEEWPLTHRDYRSAHYAAMRMDGTGHKLADCLARQTAPGALTDREFLEGHCNGNQFAGQEHVGDAYAAIAAAEGVDITGAVYINGLASYSGDPRAWVRGRGDVLKLCAERGYNADGAVTVRHGSRDETPDVAVADDIIEQRVMAKLEKDPSLMLRDPGEVRHEAKQEMKPHWSGASD